MFSNFAATFRHSGVGRWFYGRDVSEQRIISIVVALTLVLLLWAYVWKPVSDWRSLAQNRHTNAQQTLDWLKTNEQAARQAARSGNSNRGARALIQVVNKAAQAQNIAVNSLQPDSNGSVGVVLQAQSFNQIIRWITQLHKNNDVLVERANFDEQGEPGYVNAQIRLN